MCCFSASLSRCCAAARTAILAGSEERFPVDYHMMHLTPVIVMLVKYFAWFLFGLKKESWSLDYKKLFGCRKKTTV